MILDRTTYLLFHPFFREVGNPTRSFVRNEWEFIRFVDKYNGITDVFVSVYPANGIIDKIFFDIDNTNLRIVRKFYNYLVENDYTVIPVVSGRKGFHFYVLLKPKLYDEEGREKLTNATYSIILDSGLYSKERGEGNEWYIPKCDTRIIGDIRRLTRVPNTLRPHGSYCTYLPPDFVNMTAKEISGHMKSSHTYDYEIRKLPTLDDFEKVSVELFRPSIYSESFPSPSCSSNVGRYLKPILRPCLFKKLFTFNPSHDVRVAATIDLLDMGFSENQIFKFYSQIGWEDWDESITQYQISNIKNRRYRYYSCKKLRRLGIADNCPEEECLE